MIHWETARRWLKSLFFGGMVFLLSSCPGGPGSDECGGADALVACVHITSIQPTDISGTSTRDVDVVQSICPDLSIEPFGRHDASITFSNSIFPTADDSLAVTIQGYTVTYSIVTCPIGATCPPLVGFTEGDTLTIPEGGTVTATFSLVPINVKDDFNAQGGSAGAFPVYRADYEFTAVTNDFEDQFTVRGSTSFVMGNFNLCPST